jgi:ubiquinone/menaquinone biosynthesis C-methylase UbiE
LTVLAYVLAFIGIAALSLLALRVVSRRRSTACPAWLVPLLENPYMNAVAGSELLLDRAGVEAGQDVLDVGSGPGRLTLPAADRVGPTGRVVALDLQPAMIHRLRARFTASGVKNIETILGGAGEGKVPAGSFDRAFLVTVLGEIVDRQAALREVYEALRLGGLLSVTEVLPDPHYQSRGRVRRAAESVGFTFRETLGPWYAFTMNFIKNGEP